ncbi:MULTISPECIES: hypothetical protein [Inquilinus]|jgi:hypothetical protein|uniref:Uncharacterized protein n=1 Tax=Inquilinus ginsengisoli TaxID=363840 RepID=A0ABU1JVU6_9PROT|nr:hypothetical protein [Inquilinus ginsengisoli]MDR6292721.1 hypothetical protein [Inquilinus ginsengisoli]
MRIELRRAVILTGFAAFLALGACAQPADTVVVPGTLPANVPPGSTLESSTTQVDANGTVVNRNVYRAPNQLVTNGPQCTKGDPQCP